MTETLKIRPKLLSTAISLYIHYAEDVEGGCLTERKGLILLCIVSVDNFIIQP